MNLLDYSKYLNWQYMFIMIIFFNFRINQLQTNDVSKSELDAGIW